jgi:hypothetical protein
MSALCLMLNKMLTYCILTITTSYVRLFIGNRPIKHFQYIPHKHLTQVDDN